MMNRKQIQETIIDRIRAMQSSCNRLHINHNDGVLRGLLWALNGTDPGASLNGAIVSEFDASALDILKQAGIQCQKNGDKVEFTIEP